MKREAKLLLNKSIDSLALSVEHFNRVEERGRIPSVLIFLDHSFEMLLKACIVERGGKIREQRASETIGFDACVRRSLDDGAIKFISEEQAITLQTINGLRDAAQHYLIEITEEQLYIHAQSGVTLFGDIMKKVFGKDLRSVLPPRVLPVSTMAPRDITSLFNDEIKEIKKLLEPGKRKRTEAYARMRPFAILDATIQGSKNQPSNNVLKKKGDGLLGGQTWQEIFPGIASIELKPESDGTAIGLRITKKEGIPISIVPEGTPGASVVALKRVNELDYYNLGHKQLSEHVGLTPPKATAAVWYGKIQENPDYFMELKVGKSKFKRYSQKAITAVKEIIDQESMDTIWKKYKESQN